MFESGVSKWCNQSSVKQDSPLHCSFCECTITCICVFAAICYQTLNRKNILVINPTKIIIIIKKNKKKTVINKTLDTTNTALC